MAASNAAMIKINFLEDPELATKLMKVCYYFYFKSFL